MRSIFFISFNRPTFHASGAFDSTAVHHMTSVCQVLACLRKVVAGGGRSAVFSAQGRVWGPALRLCDPQAHGLALGLLFRSDLQEPADQNLLGDSHFSC